MSERVSKQASERARKRKRERRKREKEGKEVYQKRQDESEDGVPGVGGDARGEFDHSAEHALHLAVAGEDTGDAPIAGARRSVVLLLLRRPSAAGSRVPISAAVHRRGPVLGRGLGLEVVRGRRAAAVRARGRANGARPATRAIALPRRLHALRTHFLGRRRVDLLALAIVSRRRLLPGRGGNWKKERGEKRNSVFLLSQL